MGYEYIVDYCGLSNPVLQVMFDESPKPNYDGIYLQSANTACLQTLIQILKLLDENTAPLEICQQVAKSIGSMAQLFDVICNMEYLNFEKAVTQLLSRKLFTFPEFLSFENKTQWFDILPETLELKSVVPVKILISAYLDGSIDEPIFDKSETMDLVRYLYHRYSYYRVKDREVKRETSYFLFDDQIYYLPIKYHLVHEELEENTLSQIEVVREECITLLTQLRLLFSQIKQIFEFFNEEWTKDDFIEYLEYQKNWDACNGTKE